MRCPCESVSPSDEVTISNRLAFTSWATLLKGGHCHRSEAPPRPRYHFRMTGTMFRFQIRSIVFEAFCRRIRLSSSCVSSSWATLTPCCLKAVAYMRISSGWPRHRPVFQEDLQVAGRDPTCGRPRNRRTADDDTGIPVFDEAISDANRRNCLPSSAPRRSRTPVPNLITIRAIEQLVDSGRFPALTQRSLSAEGRGIRAFMDSDHFEESAFKRKGFLNAQRVAAQ